MAGASFLQRVTSHAGHAHQLNPGFSGETGLTAEATPTGFCRGSFTVSVPTPWEGRRLSSRLGSATKAVTWAQQVTPLGVITLACLPQQGRAGRTQSVCGPAATRCHCWYASVAVSRAWWASQALQGVEHVQGGVEPDPISRASIRGKRGLALGSGVGGFTGPPSAPGQCEECS